MKLLNNPFLSFFLAASCLASAVASAQEERWYRVELLIFSQGSQAAQLSETWEPTPALIYPERGRFLVNTQAAAARQGEYDANGEIDALGYQTITIKSPPLEGNASQAVAVGAIDAPAQQIAPGQGSVTTGEPAAPTSPTPFVLLPHTELEFRGKAAYMARTGRYHTLFHETWVQPMSAENAHRIRAIPVNLNVKCLSSGVDVQFHALPRPV